MSGEKNWRKRDRSRRENSKLDAATTIEKFERSDCSYDNEREDRTKRSSSIGSNSSDDASLGKNRKTSGLSAGIRNGVQIDEGNFEKSDNEANSDNLTYTKNDNDNHKKIFPNRADAMRKVEDYLMRQDTEEREISDNDSVKNEKSRKSNKRRRDDTRRSEFQRIEHVRDGDDDDDDDRSNERENGDDDDDRSNERENGDDDDRSNERENGDDDYRTNERRNEDDDYRTNERQNGDDDDRSNERQNGDGPRTSTAIGERRKWKKHRNEEIRILTFVRSEDDEGYDDEAGKSFERIETVIPNENTTRRKKQRRRWKKRRTNENGDERSKETLVNVDTNDDDRRRSKKHRNVDEQPRISARRKRRRSKTVTSGGDQARNDELPITEILRKSQENSKNRFEETVRFPELTTDKIYVQRGNCFSAVKITDYRVNKDGRRAIFRKSEIRPIKVAIVAQRMWNYVGLFHQGLLAGMAMMHLLLIQTFFENGADFVVDYSLVSEIYTNIFSFLVTMSFVSVFDKFDLGHLNLKHVREIYAEHSRSFLAVPIYVATFCLHQASLLVDDKISLLNHEGNSTLYENNSTEITSDEEIVVWRKIILAKDGLAVLAWLFVVLGSRRDMLLDHLKTMDTYTDTTSSSPVEYRRTQRQGTS